MSSNPVHVAVGVVFDQQDRILIAQRPAHVHQGGLWEFPGGKLGKSETAEQALQRELFEELGIKINEAQHLIQIPHDYGDKKVLLDVFTVASFTGIARGREQQSIKWVSHSELDYYRFPEANRGIIMAVQLPSFYMITNEYAQPDIYLHKIEHAVKHGIRLIQLRAKNLEEKAYRKLADELDKRYAGSDVHIMLNCSLEIFHNARAAGLHLTSRRMLQFDSRPIDEDRLLSASVHSEAELLHAMQLQADFIVVSPVKQTTSHPGVEPIGWLTLAKLTRQANCPVYALGGLGYRDLAMSQNCGAQGIAGISAFDN